MAAQMIMLWPIFYSGIVLVMEKAPPETVFSVKSCSSPKTGEEVLPRDQSCIELRAVIQDGPIINVIDTPGISMCFIKNSDLRFNHYKF